MYCTEERGYSQAKPHRERCGRRFQLEPFDCDKICCYYLQLQTFCTMYSPTLYMMSSCKTCAYYNTQVGTCFNEMRGKEERGKQGQTNNKAKQHSTPKAVTFPKKNELPWMGLKPTTLHSSVPITEREREMWVDNSTIYRRK